MYHKRFWGAFDQNDFQTPWQKLDGIFTSAPAAIGWGNERVDVFGLGLDHAMYRNTAIGLGAWSTQWARIGGTFTSAASLIVVGGQLNLFARGDDFTCRGNHSDGTTWFGFQNHGGNLASPPVAVSWGPDRIDLFAIFNDGALWHRWWDSQIWNPWESLGGNYAGEPAAVSWAPGRLDVFAMGSDDCALHHHWFSGDTWSVPEVLDIGVKPGDGTRRIADRDLGRAEPDRGLRSHSAKPAPQRHLERLGVERGTLGQQHPLPAALFVLGGRSHRPDHALVFD